MLVTLGTTAYDKTKSSGGIDGIGRYTEELLQGFSSKRGIKVQSHSFFSDKTNKIQFPHFSSPFITSSLISSLARRETLTLKRMISGTAIYHAPDHYVPFISSIPTVATIHDVIPFEFPEWFSLKQRIYHKLLKRSFGWPSHYITVSEYSKNQIINNLGYDPKTISVVYNGVDSSWFLSPTNDTSEIVKIKFNVKKPFFLFAGTLQKRKNVLRAISAFGEFNKSQNQKYDLLLVGREAKHNKKFCQELNIAIKNTPQVYKLNYVELDDLKALMHLAHCFLFPSLAEGFGLPILEAFAAKTPVIAGANSSMLEITENAALLVDANDTRTIIKAMQMLENNESLRNQLMLGGARRADQFSWERTCTKTLEVYEKTIDEWKFNRSNV